MLSHWPHGPKHLSCPRSRSEFQLEPLPFFCETTSPSVWASLPVLTTLIQSFLVFSETAKVDRPAALLPLLNCSGSRIYIELEFGLIPTNMPWVVPLLGSCAT
jgi:hypothetical protein